MGEQAYSFTEGGRWLTQSQTSAADCGLAVCNLSGGRGCYGLRGGGGGRGGRTRGDRGAEQELAGWVVGLVWACPVNNCEPAPADDSHTEDSRATSPAITSSTKLLT